MKRYVGEPCVRQREVVGNERTGVDDDDTHEQVMVLRLQNIEKDGKHVDGDEHLMQKPGAYLVLITLVGIMDDADE